jgi:hypothetical protein
VTTAQRIGGSGFSLTVGRGWVTPHRCQEHRLPGDSHALTEQLSPAGLLARRLVVPPSPAHQTYWRVSARRIALANAPGQEDRPICLPSRVPALSEVERGRGFDPRLPLQTCPPLEDTIVCPLGRRSAAFFVEAEGCALSGRSPSHRNQMGIRGHLPCKLMATAALARMLVRNTPASPLGLAGRCPLSPSAF